MPPFAKNRQSLFLKFVDVLKHVIFMQMNSYMPEK